MENGLCGFCRRKDVEDICGKLHKEKTAKDGWVVAHHRCMQYCALLVQYKFDNFGGFKIAKVLEEYKRGKLTKCSLCATKKNKKKNVFVSGATAGCAVKSCRRSFHYYCARMSDTAITKRLVVHVKSKGEKTVLYRVFCSKEHEQQYRQNLKKYLATTGDAKKDTEYVSDSDETKQGDDDDDSNGIHEIDEDKLSQNTNSTFIQLSDLECSPLKSPRGARPTKQTRGSEPSNGDDGKSESSDDRTNNAYQSSDDEVLYNKRKHSLEDGSESEGSGYEPEGRKKRRVSAILNGHSEKRVTFSPGPENLSRNSPSTSKGKKINSEESRNGKIDQTGKKSEAANEKNAVEKLPSILTSKLLSTNKKGEKSSITYSRAGGDVKLDKPASSSKKKSSQTCAVCIVGEPECSQKLQQQLEKTVCKQFNLKPKHFFLWQHLDDSPRLSKQNMVYFIKDLAKHFMDGDVTEVGKLLFDGTYLTKKDKTQYKLQGAFLQDLGDDIIKKTQELVWSSIQSQLSSSDGIGCVVKVEGKHNLVLLLDNSGIDSDGTLREKLGICEEEGAMITWTSATVVTKTSDEDDQEMGLLEKETILAWIDEVMPTVSHVFVHPQEEILMPKWEGGSVADEIATHLQSVKKEKVQAASVVIFKQVDDEVVNFLTYCRKAIQKVLPSCARTGCNLLVIIDIRQLTTTTIQQQMKDIFQTDTGSALPVTLRSAFDPSSIPVSCVVAEVDTNQLKVQKDKVKNVNKTSPEHKQYVSDNQTPSTSSGREKSNRRSSLRGNSTTPSKATPSRLSISIKK